MKKYYNILFIIFSIVIIFSLSPKIKADTKATLTSNVNVRTGAGTGYSSVAKLSKGTTIYLVSTKTYSGTGCSDGWYQITYKENTRYVCSSYVKIKTSTVSYNTEDWTARVYATSVTLRSTPRTDISTNKSGTLLNGTNLTILGTYANKGGTACTNGWYKVRYHGTEEAYICKNYVIIKEKIMTADSTYGATLKSAGFPDSYINYLTYLHNSHPNWQFSAIDTNLNWDTVIEEESGKNATFSTISVYRTSSTAVDGKSWFEATDGLNAFYLDPRNFLTEKFIFQFEHLGYDEKYEDTYENLVKAILGNGDLNTKTVVNAILKSGKTNKVSPVHLASRIKQEVGVDGGVATSGAKFTYEGKTYSSCYNFFNIGASDGANAVYRGLAAACNKGWITIEKSIVGGGATLANNYIAQGQYTLYFQKFNTSPSSTNSLFYHQYMSNVHAPTSEASTTYWAYSDNKALNDIFIFAIPIYKNMPKVISLPSIGSTINTLQTITINGTQIDGFDSDIVGYTYYVNEDVTSVDIGASVTDTNSTIDGTGIITLDEESDTTISTITVTSQTGSEKKYTITIIKRTGITDIDELIKNINLNIKNNVAYNIVPDKKISTIKSLVEGYTNSINLVFKDSSGKEITNYSTIFATGQTITLTSGDTKKIITISVKGDTSGDGKVTVLDLLQVQKHILKSSTLSNQRFASGDTNNDNQITVLDLLRVQKYILGDLKF